MKKKKLRKIAPILSRISKMENGFNCPENYLNNFEDRFFATLTGKHLPKLLLDDSFKVPDGYLMNFEEEHFVQIDKIPYKATVPTGYFEQFENNVFNQLAKQTRKGKLKNLVIRIAAPIAIAASFVLILLLNTSHASISFETLATSEIEEFIENGAISIDFNTLAVAFPDMYLDTNSMIEDFTDEEVLDYLYNENLDEYYFDN